MDTCTAVTVVIALVLVLIVPDTGKRPDLSNCNGVSIRIYTSGIYLIRSFLKGCDSSGN